MAHWCLGGIGIPFSSQKNTKEQLNYFLYNIRCTSTIQKKIDMTIIYMQIEVGSFQQFFPIPFQEYGHLVLPLFCVQLWQELEHKGILICPSESSTWTPSPLCKEDRALMDLTIKCYDTKGSLIINWCRQYLNLVSVIDHLILKTLEIHPSYLSGNPPMSRMLTIKWPPILRPPKRYWTLWSHCSMY